ncbi:MAG: DUF2318 domain-containing protein [Nitrospirae bacterium]|nr:DUF2318 domain-containing protein [Nitrospirota bacterium]
MRNLAVILAIFAFFSCKGNASYPPPPLRGDMVELDIRDLKEKLPVFYSYIYEGRRVNFFVLKINGNVSSFFDACMKCYPKRLGYFPEDESLVCRACGIKYPIDALKGIGTCYPIGLEGRAEKDSYIIEKGELIKGTQYF